LTERTTRESAHPPQLGGTVSECNKMVFRHARKETKDGPRFFWVGGFLPANRDEAQFAKRRTYIRP
jgi:hypothetical protein